jgi:hypothetical protein
MNHEQQLVWHYTLLPKVKIIQADPVLKPFAKPGQVPAVWFSTEQVWEPTAACNWEATLADGTKKFLNMIELFQAHGGIYRFGVLPEAAPLTWHEYQAMIDGHVAEAMLEGALELGADPDHWRASLDPVGHQQWLRVEMWMEEDGWELLKKKA